MATSNEPIPAGASPPEAQPAPRFTDFPPLPPVSLFDHRQDLALALSRPPGAAFCTLTVNLLCLHPVPDVHPHYAHWGYQLQAPGADCRIDFRRNGTSASLLLNGRRQEPFSHVINPCSGNGFYFWEVAWREPDGQQAQAVRGQIILFQDESDLPALMQAKWPDSDRRNPGPENLARDILRLLDQAARDLARDFPDARVLDLGCGNKPYYPYFHGRCARYLGVDLMPGMVVDEVMTTRVPCDDASVDLVLCTQVLEHVRNPWAISREIHRVLRPGGLAFVSAPFCWHYHPWPNDYWRFTREGLEALFESFQVVRHQADCGTLATLQREMGFLCTRTGIGVPPAWGAPPDALTGARADAILPSHHLLWLRKP